MSIWQKPPDTIKPRPCLQGARARGCPAGRAGVSAAPRAGSPAGIRRKQEQHSMDGPLSSQWAFCRALGFLGSMVGEGAHAPHPGPGRSCTPGPPPGRHLGLRLTASASPSHPRSPQAHPGLPPLILPGLRQSEDQTVRSAGKEGALRWEAPRPCILPPPESSPCSSFRDPQLSHPVAAWARPTQHSQPHAAAAWVGVLSLTTLF